jgi:glucose/arabinose dehydrogenase
MSFHHWLLRASIAFLIFFLAPMISAQSPKVLQTDRVDIRAEVVVDGLSHPWGMAFLPSGDLLITERSGRLLRVSSKQSGDNSKQVVTGLPAVAVHGQGGLLDVALHPNFVNNQLLYFSFSAEEMLGGLKKIGTILARGRLVGTSLSNVEQIFAQHPKVNSRHHFGSRIVFDNAGYLYLTLGDRGQKGQAQNLENHIGTVIRLHDDGRVPADNPFVGQKGVATEIFSYGHRNQQGAFLHPLTGEVWTHEHGPQGGDELNVIEAGKNYGWPVITYGVNYGSGTKIGEGSAKEGMEQPLYYWVPSIAPSGMTYYDVGGNGAAFMSNGISAWQGNVLIGSLKFQQLVRLVVDGRSIVAEERMFSGEFGRIRDVKTGPDGAVYLLTDASNGQCIRLTENRD